MPSRSGLFGLPVPDEELRQKAIAEPGPSWRHWFFHSFSKVYIGLALFVADALLVSEWLELRNLTGLFATLVAAIYLELLLYQYLWYEPEEKPRRIRTPSRPVRSPLGSVRTPTGPRFERTIVHPFPFGRWSETGERFRRTGSALAPGSGPDPEEFA
jgi:hypothetical protein